MCLGSATYMTGSIPSAEHVSSGDALPIDMRTPKEDANLLDKPRIMYHLDVLI